MAGLGIEKNAPPAATATPGVASAANGSTLSPYFAAGRISPAYSAPNTNPPPTIKNTSQDSNATPTTAATSSAPLDMSRVQLVRCISNNTSLA